MTGTKAMLSEHFNRYTYRNDALIALNSEGSDEQQRICPREV
jgi:hypothetical protein